MGLNHDNSAWVEHRQEDGTVTTYRVYPNVKKAEYLPRDYCVGIDAGPDVLDHDEVRRCGHDAFLDAFGAH